MSDKLKCFISYSHNTDISTIKNVLIDNNVEVFDIYDISLGDSIQKILKAKLRQSDFALFIISNDSRNILYEMGVCEGMGKKHFVLIDEDVEVPFYVENKLFQRAKLSDKSFIELSIKNILKELKKNRRSRSKTKIQGEYSYDEEIKKRLEFHLNHIKYFRDREANNSNGKDLELLIEEIFRTIKLNYVKNFSSSDKGVDFALWSNELSRVIGNPIIVEIKHGTLSEKAIKNAEYQIKRYTEKSDARLALLLYLDNNNNRFKTHSSLNPLIISYDIEDFVNDLTNHRFENIILSQRNRIAHGVD